MEPSLAPVISSALDPHSDAFAQNRADVLEQLGVIDGLLDAAAAGGGAESTQRLRERGKMPIRERIAAVLDPDSPFLEISAAGRLRVGLHRRRRDGGRASA